MLSQGRFMLPAGKTNLADDFVGFAAELTAGCGAEAGWFARGTSMTPWHLGHLPRWPANSSRSRKVWRQLPQVTSIGTAGSPRTVK